MAIRFNFFFAIAINECLGHPLVGVRLVDGKSVGICILPSYSLRLLALPFLCRTATQKPTLEYV